MEYKQNAINILYEKVFNLFIAFFTHIIYIIIVSETTTNKGIKMKWNQHENREILEGTNLYLVFSKIGTNLYAKVYLDGVLMFSFSNPLKTKTGLKEQISELYISHLENVSVEKLKQDKRLNEVVWCELNRIRNDETK